MPKPRHDAPIPHKGDTLLKGNKFANLFISRNELFQAGSGCGAPFVRNLKIIYRSQRYATHLVVHYKNRPGFGLGRKDFPIDGSLARNVTHRVPIFGKKRPVHCCWQFYFTRLECHHNKLLELLPSIDTSVSPKMDK